MAYGETIWGCPLSCQWEAVTRDSGLGRDAISGRVASSRVIASRPSPESLLPDVQSRLTSAGSDHPFRVVDAGWRPRAVPREQLAIDDLHPLAHHAGQAREL